jgi:hypothetical protein
MGLRLSDLPDPADLLRHLNEVGVRLQKDKESDDAQCGTPERQSGESSCTEQIGWMCSCSSLA